MERDDSVYLRHVLDASGRILEYLERVDRVQFEANHQLQDAVIRQLEIIGEAVKHVSRGMRSMHPEIRWQGVGGMRDKLIHGYFGVDLEMVWFTAQNDIPVLIGQIEGILKELGK